MYNDMIYLESASVCPYYNLALEEVLLENVSSGEPGFFMLWRNAPAVIIGRHQNAWTEVNLPALEKKGVKLVRRMSGGGAVYHDLGNLNFSFILPCAGSSDKLSAGLLEPLLRCLKNFDLDVFMQGRNDISLAGAGKFSGMASLQCPGGFQLHGTILYDVKLDELSELLSADPEKYRSKGVPSVRARVANLKPFLPGLDLASFWAELKKSYNCRQEPVPATIAAKAAKLAADKYSQDFWNLGKSPPMDFLLRHRFAFGSLELHIKEAGGLISAVEITGDFIKANVNDSLPLSCLAKALVGLGVADRENWVKAWSAFDWSRIFYRCERPDEIFAWLLEG